MLARYRIRLRLQGVPVWPCLLVSAMLGCASLHERRHDADDLDVDDKADFQEVRSTTLSGFSTYLTAAGAKGRAEWITCSPEQVQASATVLLMHQDRAAYEPKRFCQGWHAQAFLTQGYNVVTINRPGFGQSSGERDFTGPASIAAVTATLPQAMQAAKLRPPVSGLWGYGSGATAAALTAKSLSGLKFLILGGGIYDYEETLHGTTDAGMKADIAVLKAGSGGDKEIEQRSVGYDTSGLPARIEIYHGSNDQVAPLSQAKAFADTLTSSGQVQASLHVLDGQGHDLPWIYHRHLLEALIKGLKEAPDAD